MFTTRVVRDKPMIDLEYKHISEEIRDMIDGCCAMLDKDRRGIEAVCETLRAEVKSNSEMSANTEAVPLE